MRQLVRLWRRLAQILRYALLAKSAQDALPLLVLGYARGNTLDPRGGALASYLRQRYGAGILVRPSRLGGLRLMIDPTDLSHFLIFEEFFFAGGYDLRKVGFTPTQVVDCGGHIGMFTLLAAHAYPQADRVVFEPNPANTRWIEAQRSHNPGIAFELMRAAVSTVDGETSFAANSSCAGTMIKPLLDHENGQPTGSYRVQMIDLLRRAEDWKNSRLLLKMDIEGEEEELLPLLIPKLPRQTAIFFETHRGQASWNTLSVILNSHGFETEALGESEGLYIDGFARRL